MNTKEHSGGLDAHSRPIKATVLETKLASTSDPFDIQSNREDLGPQSSAQDIAAGQGHATVALDLTECDRELINVPGSIQPHGLLLIADPETLAVVAGGRRH